MRNRLTRARRTLRDWTRGDATVPAPSDAAARILYGSGRSGTTWLLQELARLTGARPVFEPFHPIDVPRSSELVPRGYLPPETRDDALLAHVRAVLDGTFRSDRTDTCVIPPGPEGYRGRVIKEIHSHLWAGWITRAFPDVAHAVVVRHPFAQVGSRSALEWSDRKLDVIAADALVKERHVPDFDALLARANGPFERGVLLWAVDNRVLLRSLDPASVYVFGYEEAVADPATVGDLIEHFGYRRPATETLAADERSVASLMAQPGAPERTVGDENAKWLDARDPAEIDSALEILSALGFDGVFDASGSTSMDALRLRVSAGFA